MKRQYVEMLQDGDVVNDYFLATRRDLRTQASGGKFLGMVFKDRTGEIGGILWQNAQAVAKLFEVGDVVNVRGTVTSYQERLQVRVDQVLPLRESEYDAADLSDAPLNANELLNAFVERLKAINDPWLSKLVASFLNDDAFMAKLKVAAAGKKWHHAYPGGLAQHCHEMARIADTAAELYPSLNRDLLMTAIFLHDAGKLDEMTHGMLVDYTPAGKLLGHLSMGAVEVQRRIEAIPGFPEHLRLGVLHCILAHHGELINGSPVLPQSLEAIVLYQIDNLSAQANATVRIIDETRNRGERWSEYIALIQRCIWTGEC